jgi:putative restriction endonuclease
MTFYEWLQHKGLSAATVQKYNSAISGSISTWAMDQGLIDGPITSLSSQLAFDVVALNVRLLPTFQKRNTAGNGMYEAALRKFSEYLAEGFENDLEHDLSEIISHNELSITEKTNLVKSRVGQGSFRQKLINYWGGCAVTGLKDTNLLVASHIKPWSVSTHIERLDSYNGLLLTPNLDKAFDAGFVTFNSQGLIQLSPQLCEPKILGITPDLYVELTEMHECYMAFHRAHVFRST